MVLFVDNTGYIYAINEQLELSEIKKYKNAVWYEGSFDFDNITSVEGKVSKLYLTSKGEIEVRYGDIMDSNPSQLDRIEEALNKSHEAIKNEAIDEYTSMLMEEGVI